MGGGQITVLPLAGIPMVQPGDDIAAILGDAIGRCAGALRDRDILVVAQKIVSKAEGRFADLGALIPSPRAHELAAATGKDARLIEAVLQESSEILRAKRNVIVVEHRLGLVMANAGIDQSNLDASDQGARVLLLPADPDASATRLREALAARFGAAIGVVISDSVGRAWRLGTVGLAIGAAGVPSLIDRRGEADLTGRKLEVTEVAFADAVAAAAVLAMGEGAEGTPAVLVRGLEWSASEKPASALLRPRSEDMFR